MIDVKTLISDPTTISRNVVANAEARVELLGPKFVKIIEKHGGSFGLDYGKRINDYLCVTLHFFDDDW
jgi:hypothetical protein